MPKSKECIVFGSGMVAPPLIDTLKEKGYRFSVASNMPERAEELVGDYADADTYSYDLEQDPNLAEMQRIIGDAQAVVSLLPAFMHPHVAESCLERKADLVTASYVSEAMQSMDGQARKNGLTFMNEVGLDPGLDHMSAMQIIDSIHESGGDIVSFKSYCGGLPVPEDADNPFKYKFSWSPKGVLLASRSSARYLQNGGVMSVPEGHLHEHTSRYTVQGEEYEGYPNRDSTPYQEIYNIQETQTLIRGTLRYDGWTNIMSLMYELGYLKDEQIDMEGRRYVEVAAELMNFPGDTPTKSSLIQYLHKTYGDKYGEDAIEALRWVGALSEDVISNVQAAAPIDLMTELMLSKMAFSPGEHDAAVMIHEFDYVEQDGTRKQLTSELNVTGDEQYTAMAKTVGYTAASVARLIIEDVYSDPGVQIPTKPEVYLPVLAELEERYGIAFTER